MAKLKKKKDAFFLTRFPVFFFCQKEKAPRQLTAPLRFIQKGRGSGADIFFFPGWLQTTNKQLRTVAIQRMAKAPLQ